MKRLQVGTEKSREAEHKTVEAEDNEEMRIIFKIKVTDEYRYNHVKPTQREFKAHHLAEMFTEQVIVLRDITIVEIRKSEVQEDIQQQGIIKNNGIFTVTDIADLTLNFGFHKNCPERLDQQIQHHEDRQIEYEFFLLHLKAAKIDEFMVFASTRQKNQRKGLVISFEFLILYS